MTVFAECGSKIANEIRSAEQDVRALLESVPADQRILITDHEALGYLANVYGLRGCRHGDPERFHAGRALPSCRSRGTC